MSLTKGYLFNKFQTEKDADGFVTYECKYEKCKQKFGQRKAARKHYMSEHHARY